VKRRNIGSVACAIALGFGTLGAAIGSGVITAVPAGAAAGPVVYSSMLSPVPPNVTSLGYQATQTAEFGDEVGLASHATPLASARVLMSSWGCETGTWNGNNCATTPGATFSVPITFNVYSVNPGPSVGALLVSRTQTFNIPYRPSASVACTGGDAGKWYSGGTCYSGLAVPITFDFTSGPQVVLPDHVIWTVAFNTTNYGSHPIGTSACSASAAGCGYDALNVGLNTTSTASVGTDTDPDAVFWNTSNAANYTDGGAGGTGTLREDTGWAPYVPAGELQLAAAPPPPPPPPSASVPGAPRKVSAVPANGRAKVRWTAPASNGGSAVTEYVVTAVTNRAVQAVQTFSATRTSGVVKGLTNGTPYRFRVAARNGVGKGAAAAAKTLTRVGAPGAPSRPTVSSPSSGSLQLTFKKPAANGAKVTSFRALCVSAHGVNGTQTGKGTTLVVSGLTPGKPYVCRVTARNSRGTGPVSAPSARTTA
jgi:Fibronectin type III domain